MTTVTKENALKQDVQLSLTLKQREGGHLTRVTLTVSGKSAKYGIIGQPGLYLYAGSREIGRVALYSDETTSDKKTYWCDIAKECLDFSMITIPCYAENPAEGTELCAQSMEYTIKLTDFMEDIEAEPGAGGYGSPEAGEPSPQL